MLCAWQGFLNVCFYVWSNNNLRRWLLSSLAHSNSRQSSSRDADLHQQLSEYATNAHSSNADEFSLDASGKEPQPTSILKHSKNTPSHYTGGHSWFRPVDRSAEKKSAPVTIDELDSERYVRFGE